ncbi:MAG: endonuclease V [Hydrogenothermaceae bacterium]|nr:endonuclease V [Hydrogenothermaceae bacterium]
MIEEFIKIQNELSKRVKIEDKIDINNITKIAGVDCSFVEKDGHTIGISCIVVMDRQFNILETQFGEGKVDIPYIPTFLAFREIPIIMKAYEKVKEAPDIFIFDGQGILHPRNMGIATHFGVLTDTVTIGCGKSHLYGKFLPPPNQNMAKSPVYVNDKIYGYALRVKKNTNPIFISPGNNISVDSSLYVIINNLRGYKLPEAVRIAHNSLQEYRKKLIKED